MQECQRGRARLLGIQNASLRSPRSYPDIMSPENSKEKVETKISPKRVSPGKDSNTSHQQDSRTLPLKPIRLQTPLNNIVSVDYDPALFQMLKPLSLSKTCHFCGLHGARRCSQCRITYYCSVECQKKDWTAHSVICKPSDMLIIRKDQGDQKEHGERGAESKHQTERKEVQTVNRRQLFHHCEMEEFPSCDVCVLVSEEEFLMSVIEWHMLSMFLFFKRDVACGQCRVRYILSDPQTRPLECQGLVVEFSNPCHFYVQIYNTKSVESLLKMSTALNDIYRNPQNIQNGYTPAIGEVCVAKYSQDQHWYRVFVQDTEVSLKTAQVLYIDYGNQETVSFSDLQQMHKDLELLPPAAIKCSLANISAPSCGWTPECLLDVRKLLLGKPLAITIISCRAQEEMPSYGVDIFLPSGVNMDKLLVEKGYAFTEKGKSPIRNHNPPQELPHLEKAKELLDGKSENPSSESQTQTLKMIAVAVGNVFNAAITDIQSPDDFFCQQLQNAKDLAELMDSMSKHYKVMPASPNFVPAVGDMCSAQFTEDDRWYRASILKYTSHDSVLVGYVDYGNVEILPVSRLRPILPSMMMLPLQAIKCRLAGVKPPSEKWSKEATAAMMTLVANKIITVKVVAQSEFSLIVDLIDVSVNPELLISNYLIKAGMAVEKELTTSAKYHSLEDSKPNEDESLPLKWIELPIGRPVEVSVCVLLSPGEFYCQLCSDKDLSSLREVNRLLSQYCLKHQSKDYNPKHGELCCSFFSGDKNWYRAQVIKLIETEKAKVNFLDYGNVEEVAVDKLCKMPSQFLELPFQAVKCSLAGVKPIGNKWRRESCEKFQMCVAGLKLQAKAISKHEDGYSVELVDTKSSKLISDVLIAEGAAISDDDRKNRMSSGDSKSVHKISLPGTSPREITSNRYSANGEAPAVTDPSGRSILPIAKQTSSVEPVKDLSKESSVVNKMTLNQRQEDVCDNRQWKSIDLPLNEALQACVISVISPDLFFIFPKEIKADETRVQRLQRVLVDIAGYCNAERSGGRFTPSVGEMCCAQFTADGQFYRALVLDTSECAAKIIYVDYGNIETLPFSSLHPIRESSLVLPVQIVKCSLAGVTPVSEKWSAECIELLNSLILQKEVTLTVLGVNGGIYTVSLEQLHSTGLLNIAEKLVSEGVAQSTTPPSKGACKGPECCCHDILKRVEKLEEIIQQLLKRESIK
ncbi:tudor domain-containing 1 isoform X1 [Pelobates cultripes]|uniref:Tudor domain-containing 1 isoform X1 n=1 Tax=Pelobates cultripes TaxID=61616 RepID=A0AAD1TEG9_PELCU|nr:tudor domain-containing 1 isoform X1 [Pelobates cultripes]